MNPLQLAFKQAHDKYGRGGTLSKKYMADLGAGAFVVLNDSEISKDDIGTLVGFLASKQARTELRLIVLRRTVFALGKGHKGTTKLHKDAMAYSAFRLEQGRLLVAVTECVSRCRSLQCLLMDRVDFNEDMMKRVGAAIARCPGTLLRLRFQGCSFGDDGFRAITPHLARCRCRVLEVVGCNLTDVSMSYVSSILKAQEGAMDHAFWNETLRISPMDFGSTIAAAVAGPVRPSHQHQQDESFPWATTSPEVKGMRSRVKGLRALSLEGNSFSDRAMYTIGRFLRHNQWLVGLNLTNNKIGGAGVKHLANALATNTVLHTLIIAGNPGYRCEIGAVLDGMFRGLPAATPRYVWSLEPDMTHEGYPAPSKKRAATLKSTTDAGKKDCSRGTSGAGSGSGYTSSFDDMLDRLNVDRAVGEWGSNGTVTRTLEEAAQHAKKVQEALFQGKEPVVAPVVVVEAAASAASATSATETITATAHPVSKIAGPQGSVGPKGTRSAMAGSSKSESCCASRTKQAVVSSSTSTSTSTSGVAKKSARRSSVRKGKGTVSSPSTKSRPENVSTSNARGLKGGGLSQGTASDSPKSAADATAGRARGGKKNVELAATSPSPRVRGRASPTTGRVRTRLGTRRDTAQAAAVVSSAGTSAPSPPRDAVPTEGDVRTMVRESLRRQLVTHLRS